MKDKALILFFFSLLLLVQGASQQASEFELSDGNFEELNFHMFNRNYNGDPVEEGLITEDQAAIIFEDMNFCTFNPNIEAGRTWSSCELVTASDSQLLQRLIDDTTPDYDFISDDNPNTGEPSGNLDVRFENTPDSPTVGQSPQFKVVGEDSRTGISNDVYLYNNGYVNLTFSPEYEEESSLIAEKTCQPDTPRYCNISVNGGDNEFSFLSPGQNTLRATAEDGAGTIVDASVDVNVGVGSPPDEDNLGRFDIADGDGYSSDWGAKLDDEWTEESRLDDGGEKLAFTEDNFGNVIIDTGKSYLYGGAYLQKQNYGGDRQGKIKLSYRISVQEDNDAATNRFGIVTRNENGDFRNSTIDTDRVIGVDQTDKTYTLTHDISQSTDTVRIGLFYNGDANREGAGSFGNGMRVIIEDIEIVDEQRELSFEKVTPDFSTGSEDLVRGQVTTFNFKADDSFDQLDLAKVNASYRLNRQNPPESQKLMSRVCEAKSPAFCFTKKFEFTPQKIGEHDIVVGIETKTGKYFQEERTYTVHGGEDLILVKVDTNDEDEVRFEAQDNFGSGDLTGKTFKALRVEQSTDFSNEYSNRCRGDASRCYVPSYRSREELSGEFRFKLLTEENGNVVNETTIDVGLN